MKVQFVVMEMSYKDEHEVKRFDTYEEAEAHIQKTPKDLLGTVEFFIRKIFTNRT